MKKKLPPKTPSIEGEVKGVKIIPPEEWSGVMIVKAVESFEIVVSPCPPVDYARIEQVIFPHRFN